MNPLDDLLQFLLLVFSYLLEKFCDSLVAFGKWLTPAMCNGELFPQLGQEVSRIRGLEFLDT
jgi:hypothetical protein